MAKIFFLRLFITILSIVISNYNIYLQADDPQYVHNLEALLNYSFNQNYFSLQKLPDFGFNGGISLLPSDLHLRPSSDQLLQTQYSETTLIIAIVNPLYSCKIHCGSRYYSRSSSSS